MENAIKCDNFRVMLIKREINIVQCNSHCLLGEVSKITVSQNFIRINFKGINCLTLEDTASALKFV